MLKYSAISAQSALLMPFDMSMDAKVTVPERLGQQLSGLPSEPYSFQKLTGQFKLKPFPWNGRCAILLLHALGHLLVL